MSSTGKDWCRHCKTWEAAERVRDGACRLGHNADYRRRYQQNPVSVRQRVYARKRSIEPLTRAAIAHLTDTWRGTCAYCTGTADTYDHVIPVSKGGKTSLLNVVPACRSCNSRKRANDPRPWVQTGWAVHPEPTTRSWCEEATAAASRRLDRT